MRLNPNISKEKAQQLLFGTNAKSQGNITLSDTNNTISFSNLNSKKVTEESIFGTKTDNSNSLSDQLGKTIFKFFDKNGDGIIKDNNIGGVNEMQLLMSYIKSFAGTDGNLSVDEALKMLKDIDTTLDNSGNVSNLEKASAAEMLGFIKAVGDKSENTLPTPQRPISPSALPKLEDFSTEEVHHIALDVLGNEIATSMGIYNSFKPGLISETFSSDDDPLSKKNQYYREYWYEKTIHTALDLANSGMLTEVRYRELWMEYALNLLTLEPDNPNYDDRKKQAADDLKIALQQMDTATLTQLVQSMSSCNEEQFEQCYINGMRQSYIDNAQNKLQTTDMIQTLPDVPFDEAAYNQSYSRKMDFDEVWQEHFYGEFNEQKILDYHYKEAECMIVTAANQRLAPLIGKLEEYLKNPSTQGIEDSYISSLLLEAQSILGISSSNNAYSQSVNEFGLPSLDFSKIDIQQQDNEHYTYQINNNLLSQAQNLHDMLLEKYNSILNGKDLNEYQEELNILYKNAFQDEPADLINLANYYVQDKQETVENVKLGVNIVGGALVVAGTLMSGGTAAPLLMGSGVAISVAGSPGVSAIEGVTREGGITEEELSAIKQELGQNILLNAAGMGIGKISGTAYQALVIKNICPRLVALSAEIGIDATASLLTDLVITGQIDLTGEGIAQLVNILVGITHSKGNFDHFLDTHAGDVTNTNQYTRVTVNQEPSTPRINTDETTPTKINNPAEHATNSNTPNTVNTIIESNPNVDYTKLNADPDYQAFIANPLFQNNPELKQLADELYASHLGQNYDTETGRQMTAEVKAEIVFRGIYKKHNEGEITLSQEIIDAFLNPIKTGIYQNLGNKITAQNKDIIDNLIIKYGLEDCNCEQYLNFVLEKTNENNIELLRLLSQKNIPINTTNGDTGLFIINNLLQQVNDKPEIINLTTKLLVDDIDINKVSTIANDTKPETIDFVTELCNDPKFIKLTDSDIEIVINALTAENIPLAQLLKNDNIPYVLYNGALKAVKPECVETAIKVYQNNRFDCIEKIVIFNKIDKTNAPYIETLINNPNLDLTKIIEIMPNLNKNTIEIYNKFINDSEFSKYMPMILGGANNAGPQITKRILEAPNFTLEQKVTLLCEINPTTQSQLHQIIFDPNTTFDQKRELLSKITGENKDFSLQISNNNSLTAEQKTLLLSIVNGKNQDVAMTLFSITNGSKLSFDEKIRIIEAASISPENIDWIFVDLYTKLDDPHIKSKVDEILTQKPITAEQAKELRMIVDAMGEFNGRISAMDNSYAAGMIRYENETGYRIPRTDADLENRLYSMREYMKTATDPELANYMFENYYIKMLQEKDIDPKVISKIQDINNTLGVKIFLSNDISDVANAINYTEIELAKWYTASEGQAILPPVIDFSTYKSHWYDETSAYGQSASSAYSELESGSIAFKNMTQRNIHYAMRHEMTHSNDLTRQGHQIPDKYNLNECFPKIWVIDGENMTFEPNMDSVNQKWVQEFRNAGIPEWHIKYAFNNPKEFIAVAAEGNMSKYSEEFKQILHDFGMPEFVFKLNNTKVQTDKLETPSFWQNLFNKYPRKFAQRLGFGNYR